MNTGEIVFLSTLIVLGFWCPHTPPSAFMNVVLTLKTLTDEHHLKL